MLSKFTLEFAEAIFENAIYEREYFINILCECEEELFVLRDILLVLESDCLFVIVDGDWW